MSEGQQQYRGVIQAVIDANTPGLDPPEVMASKIGYDVMIHTPDGQRILLENVAPAQSRYPDEMNIVPAAVGTRVPVWRFGTEWFFTVPELPEVVECGGGA